MSRTGRGILIITGVLFVGCAASHAQTFYKWTDEHGVVHLADEPPLNARGVEQRQLPPPPPAPPEAEDGKPPGDEVAANPADKAGPAEVITVSRKLTRTGPTSAHIIGAVKNVGGQAAETVEITLRSVDPGQGTLCLNEQAGVTPSTLPPGETGNFDTQIDSPCLASGIPVDVVPIWK